MFQPSLNLLTYHLAAPAILPPGKRMERANAIIIPNATNARVVADFPESAFGFKT
jgi:hypothetical protein